MSPIIQELLSQYLPELTSENYAALRAAVVTSPAYQPYGNVLLHAGESMESDPNAARDLLLECVDGWVLSPRFHQLLAYVHQESGNERLAAMEMVLADIVLHGILNSGRSDSEAPYLVTSTPDVYDVLAYLDKKSLKQTLVYRDERAFDVMTCDDGMEIWFDVTDQLATSGRWPPPDAGRP